ncbi:MAG TPA: MFS transporter [Gemmatimonadales bacterium]|nr:MFS transporter [Gemmatimonadales bacterium]
MIRRGSTALAVLTAINLFNYLDRWVVAAVAESIKRSELRPSDTELGLLATGMLVVYTVTAPLFGRLGDTRGRPRLLAFGVALWSVATALGGVAKSFAGLLVARAAVGVGEAAYGTISPSLLADYFPRSRRGRVFAVFFTAIPVGSALGYVVGGLMDHLFGWRRAFFVAGVPGLLLALLALSLDDPPRGRKDEAPAPAPIGTGAAFAALARNRRYVLTVLGYAAYTFALGGIAYWMPAFLERIRGVPKVQATAQFGAIVVATGLAGTAFGGWLGDRLLRRTPAAYLWLSGVATLVAAPLMLASLTATGPLVYWGSVVTAELLLFVSTGPVNSEIVNVVSPQVRATAMAASIFTIHAIGDVPSPLLVGVIADARSLATGVLILPAAALVGGAIWTYAAVRGEKQ